MNPGIYDNISNAEYHGGPGISNSGLSLIRRSPLHYRAKQLAANDNEPTAAQAIGTAFHALLLEPQLFYQAYTLALRQSDVPDAIEGRDQLVAMADALNAEREELLEDAVNGVDGLKSMIAALNQTRLPKLSTSGGKDALIGVIMANAPDVATREELDAMKAADLKAKIDAINETRPGQLAISGGANELAARLREAGQEFFTRQEMLDEWQAMHGTPMLIDTKGSMQDIAAALRANGKPVKLWSEVKAEWLANNGHRIVLKPEEWDQLMNMRDAVMAHPAARSLLALPGVAEQSVYWIDQATGVLCRCRPDWRIPSKRIILDLKTTDDASPAGFSKSIANWGYDVQDAFYTDGMAAVGEPIDLFLFLAVEKTARVIDGQAFGVKVYRLGEDSRTLARAKYRRDLATYAECQRTGVWPCYGDKIDIIEVPQWQFSQNAHLLEASA